MVGNERQRCLLVLLNGDFHGTLGDVQQALAFRGRQNGFQEYFPIIQMRSLPFTLQIRNRQIEFIEHLNHIIPDKPEKFRILLVSQKI